MAHADDMAAYNDTLQRIETLIQAVPAANTAPLQVMLLQADYNRAESLLTAWMNDPQAESSRAEAQQILDRISPSLLQFDTELNKQAEALLARMDETPEGDALTALELEAKRVQGIASRAAYFAAWANYYRGLLTRAAAGADPYLQARTIFRRIFGNDAALPPDTDPEGLGLESIWRARAMIGLGLSEAACGDPAHAQLEAPDEVLAHLLLPEDGIRPLAERVGGAVLHPPVDLEDVSTDPEVAPHGPLTVAQPELRLGSTEAERGQEHPGLGLQPRLRAGVGEPQGGVHHAASGPAPHRLAGPVEVGTGGAGAERRVAARHTRDQPVLARHVEGGARRVEHPQVAHVPHLIGGIRSQVMLDARTVRVAVDLGPGDVDERRPGVGAAEP